MKNLIVTLFSAVLITFSTSAQISAALKDTLDQSFKEIAKQYNFKGVSAAVYFKDGSVWESSYGNYGTKPLNSRLLYEAGSNTKTMIAALILLLEEEGKLSIDDTIGQFLPPIQYVDGAVTIKQLLNHTSGLYSFTDHPRYYPYLNNNWTKFLSIDTALAKYMNPPVRSPGVKWEYCNTGYTLLGQIIEQVEGEKLAKVLRKKLFDPLSLDHTFLSFYENYNQTHLGTWFSSGYEPEVPVSFLSSAWAAGGVICEPADLAKWAYQLYSGKVLSDAAYQKMTTTIPSEGGEEYGLGVIKRTVAGKVYYGHGGKTLQSSSMDYSLEGEYGIVAMNIEDDTYGATFGLRARLMLILEHELPNVKVPIVSNVESVKHKNQELQVYPFPATDRVYINYIDNRPFEYEVINQQGEIVKSGKALNGSLQIDRSEIRQGMYWVRTMDPAGVIGTKPIQLF